MLRNRRLARRIAGVGMAELRRQIEYTTGRAGSTLYLADRWYPSSKTCSACGVVKTKLRRSERMFRCDQCPVLDRDLNAARNLAALVEQVTGGTSSQSCVGEDKRARWKPTSDPHRAGSGYRHGKTHEVNAAPRGDGCPNRVDSRLLTLQVTVDSGHSLTYLLNGKPDCAARPAAASIVGSGVEQHERTRRKQARGHVAGTAQGGAARSDVPRDVSRTKIDEITDAATQAAQSKFPIPEAAALTLLGFRDENLRIAEELLEADVHVRGNEVTLTGKPADVAFAERVFAELVTLAGRGQQVRPDTVRRTVGMLSTGDSDSPAEVLSMDIISRRGKTIRPKTLNQKRYVDAIDEHTIVFGIGPAGTGKTYLAMAKAVQALQAKQVTRIVLTRPAVEAGERLGYLPGTLNEKIDPYLRPLYDALHDMVDPESIPRLMTAGTIEIAPLAYMRGRTLNDAFIILDEAQNTTPEQMKMFLTRLGFGSKVVVTGDITQIDLPNGQKSGLRVVRDILEGVEDLHFATLTSQDVVRHRLVGDIVDAYEKWQASQDAENPAGSGNGWKGRR
jgi:phosphate starvation-inducible PhoH-like protein